MKKMIFLRKRTKDMFGLQEVKITNNNMRMIEGNAINTTLSFEIFKRLIQLGSSLPWP